MKILKPLCVALLASFVAQAQEPKLNPDDVKKLSELLATIHAPTMRDGKELRVDAKKVDQAKTDFDKEIERLIKTAGDGLVSDYVSWNEVFHRARVANGVKNPSGAGQVLEQKLKFERGTTVLEFQYAYVFPQGYDPTKRKYPLVVCLHDDSDGGREFTGAKYLSEVVLKAPKELRDQFIFLAPNIGPKAAGKDVRIEFGTLNQFLNVYVPLRDVLSKFAVDAERLYVEGTGRGGELAANLAAYSPHQWAAAAIRSALPRKAAYLQNAALTPISFHFRQGSKVTNAKEVVAEIESMKAGGAAFSMHSYEALNPNLETRARVGMETDPVHDATAPILEAFLDKKRAFSPAAFSFRTDMPEFGKSYWISLKTYEAERDRDPAIVTVKSDRAAGVIELATTRVEELRVYLSDDVVDLSKPLKILVNGKVLHDGKLSRSVDEFFAYYRPNRMDPGLVPCAFIDLTVPEADKAEEAVPPKDGEAGKDAGKQGG